MRTLLCVAALATLLGRTAYLLYSAAFLLFTRKPYLFFLSAVPNAFLVGLSSLLILTTVLQAPQTLGAGRQPCLKGCWVYLFQAIALLIVGLEMAVAIFAHLNRIPFLISEVGTDFYQEEVNLIHIVEELCLRIVFVDVTCLTAQLGFFITYMIIVKKENKRGMF